MLGLLCRIRPKRANQTRLRQPEWVVQKFAEAERRTVPPRTEPTVRFRRGVAPYLRGANRITPLMPGTKRAAPLSPLRLAELVEDVRADKTPPGSHSTLRSRLQRERVLRILAAFEHPLIAPALRARQDAFTTTFGNGHKAVDPVALGDFLIEQELGGKDTAADIVTALVHLEKTGTEVVGHGQHAPVRADVPATFDAPRAMWSGHVDDIASARWDGLCAAFVVDVEQLVQSTFEEASRCATSANDAADLSQ